MVHERTIRCVAIARDLLESPNLDHVRYAALQLRMGIENLFYEMIPYYEEELPEDITSTKWQPKAILEAILECDPCAANDAIIAIGTKPGEYDTVMEEKPPNKKLLSKHYHRLGSYLHAPVDLIDPTIEKCLADMKKVCDALDEFTHAQTISNIRVLVQHDCICGRTIKRNMDGVKQTKQLQCPSPECRAIFDVEIEETEGSSTYKLKFQLRQTAYQCPYCNSKNHVSSSRLKVGITVACAECKKRVVTYAAFGLEPIDGEPEAKPPNANPMN